MKTFVDRCLDRYQRKAPTVTETQTADRQFAVILRYSQRSQRCPWTLSARDAFVAQGRTICPDVGSSDREFHHRVHSHRQGATEMPRKNATALTCDPKSTGPSVPGPCGTASPNHGTNTGTGALSSTTGRYHRTARPAMTIFPSHFLPSIRSNPPRTIGRE
jgi:hypothetical protein